jgi:energy-coupling factor transporter transmembrane protein EcfT
VLRLSLVGISVVGSVAHVLTQVVVVYLVFVRSSGVLLLAPWLVLSGVVMGIITGLAAIQVCRRLAAGSPGPVTDARRVAVLPAPEGRYVRAHSPLHRLRPEAKLIAVLLLALAVVLVRSPVFYAALLAALLGLTLLARVRFAALMYNLRRLATFMVLTFLLPLLFTPSGRVLFALGPVRVTLAGLATGGILTLRILLLFLATSLLALTTRPEGIATGLENLLSPLRFVGIRSRSLARVLGLSWSFFPVLWQHAQEMLRRRDSRRRGLSGIAGFLPDLVTDLYVEAELLASGTAEPDPQ